MIDLKLFNGFVSILSIKIKTTATKTNLIPGPTTPAAVEFIKRGGKYFLKAAGNKTIRVTFDFRSVPPQPACVYTGGITSAGYARTTKGYVKFNDGFRSNNDFVTSYISTWSNQIIRSGYTYQQVFDQITSSSATILSRKPEASGFDYWVNSFKDNASWTLEDLNTAIFDSANESPDGEFLINDLHD